MGSSKVDMLKELFRPFDVDLNEQKYKLEPEDLWKSSFRSASVLIPVFFRNGEWFVLLTQRAKHLARQPSTVSFPGGMQDGHETAAETALREAEEEIGLPRSSVTLVARLAPLCVRPMTLVSSFLGVIPADFVPSANEEEVEFTFFLPLKRFLSEDRRRVDHMTSGEDVHHLFHFEDDIDGVMVDTWGFTAVICIQVALVILQSTQEYCFLSNIVINKDSCFDILQTKLFGLRLMGLDPSAKL